jgi:GTP-binding protein EngB required for normal cell division
MNLKEYEQAKFSMAEIVRTAQAIDSKDAELQSASRELLTRLADDRFNLMLVGRFSRGKSTLINAVLGHPYLPTGILPLTSVITTVRYGSRPQVVLNFRNAGLPREIPLSQLPEYVTQESNPGNVKRVAYAEIQLPVELLRRGLFFVDSPGLGSSITENTETTERFFPEADAFVLITSYDSPLSEEEDRALRRIRQADRVLFVIVNKHDTVSPSERGQVLEFVKERLAQYFFSREPLVFSVSARQALEGKQSRNDELVESSGIRQLEDALFQFLTEEKAEAFLANIQTRVLAFLTQRSDLERLSKSKRREILDGLLARFRELTAPSHLPPQEVAEDRGKKASVTVGIALERRTGCWICGQVLEAVFRFLSKHQYDLTIDRAAQQEHAKRGGFCSLHTWQYENISSPYGVCASYPALAHRLASELQALANDLDGATRTFESINHLAASQGTCQVCQVRIETERNAVTEAAGRIREIARSQAGNMPACCLVHLAMTTAALGKGKPAQVLLAAHARFLERLGEDAQRYALRHDALRRYLTSEEERRASQLLLLMLAGHRNVNAPWQVEFLL